MINSAKQKQRTESMLTQFSNVYCSSVLDPAKIVLGTDVLVGGGFNQLLALAQRSAHRSIQNAYCKNHINVINLCKSQKFRQRAERRDRSTIIRGCLFDLFGQSHIHLSGAFFSHPGDSRTKALEWESFLIPSTSLIGGKTEVRPLI